MNFSRITGVLLLASAMLVAQTKPAPGWVGRSNQDAQVLLAVEARFQPEQAARQGVEGLDDKVMDLGPNVQQRRRAALEDAKSKLEQMLASETDAKVQQDLQIMIANAARDIRGIDLQQKYEIPYFNVPQQIFNGIHSLLDPQIAPSRRLAALERLRKYTGLATGSTSLVAEAEARTRERLDTPELIGPYRGQVEKDLGNAATYVDGIGKLFAAFKISGYEQPFAALKQQISEYDAFLRNTLLPRSRTDFRLPPEVYAYRLQQVGIPSPAEQLAATAHDYFNEIQAEMMTLAPVVAKEKGYSTTDYRDVIKRLKQDQWPGQSILPNYEKRVAEIEQIIRANHLVTLPARPLRIEIGSAAETAATPAPHMRAPRLIGNTGESGTFVLPLEIPAPPGAKQGDTEKMNDFTFDAASWTLIAHEGRPGHELQFDTMAQNGVSIARAVFAFNSVNAEGWGLYSEAILKPFMPPDGQLISLQNRLLRAARAFLDPELEEGKITPDQARHVLMDDCVFSKAMADEEVERYMFWWPGQAPSYFYGYTQLMQTRAAAEKALGDKFDQEKFHDFILDQGLMPPDLQRKAVMEQFVPAQNGG